MPDFKSMFATPRKAALTVACILVMLATLGTVIALAAGAFTQGPPDDAPGSGPPGQEEVPQEEGSPAPSRPGGLFLSRTMEEAREIALADAGLTASGAVFTGEVLLEDHGLWVYKFNFQAGSTTYEYEINANTGAVYSKVIKAYAVPGAAPTPAASSAPGMEDSPGGAPEDGAPLEDSPPPDGPSVPPADSAPIPTSGTVPNMVPGSAYIGVSRAKSIALDHAGLTASQVIVTRAAMDWDDGRLVYEIEFRRNGVEYEYEIDARSGAILEHEIDRD